MSKAIVKAAIHEALTEAGYDHLIDAEARVIDTVASKVGERLEAATSAAIEEARRAGFDPHDAAAVLVNVGLMEFAEAQVAANRTHATWPDVPAVHHTPPASAQIPDDGPWPGGEVDRQRSVDGAVSTTSTRPPAPRKRSRWGGLFGRS